MAYSVEIIGSDKVLSNLETIKNLLGYSREDVLDETASQITQLLQSEAPSFRGHLKSSITVKYRTKDERVVGAGEAGPSTQYPPSHYAQYVERGGGPVGTLPNVEDISLRMGLPIEQAFAFAKYLRNTGRAVRTPTMFIRNTADQAKQIFSSLVDRWVKQII